MSRKEKHLGCVTIEGCQISTRIRYCPENGDFSIGNLHRHRAQYYKDNKGHVLEYSKRAYEAKRDSDKPRIGTPEYAEYVSGEGNGNWKGKIRKTCVICGDEFDAHQSQNQYKCCTLKCAGVYKSIHYSGENSWNWRGGYDKTQPHLTPINQCIQMNERFYGSDGHHITPSIVVFIPSDLHRHIRHNIKTGENMGEINALSIQFINGGLEA